MLKIMGRAAATVTQMQTYIKKVNPKVPDSVIKMIPLYISEGAVEGVRGDIAFAQSCLETGNFTFSGSAVTLDQNNFCGMGVIKNGVKGNSFKTPQLGIRAQVQHLQAYGSTAETDCCGSTIHLCNQRMRRVCGISRHPGKSTTLWMGCRKGLWKEDYHNSE